MGTALHQGPRAENHQRPQLQPRVPDVPGYGQVQRTGSQTDTRRAQSGTAGRQGKLVWDCIKRQSRLATARVLQRSTYT